MAIELDVVMAPNMIGSRFARLLATRCTCHAAYELLNCFATTTPGVESLLAGELTALGLAPSAMEPGGVAFITETQRQLADTLLWLRTANRITVRLAAFHARTFGELERQRGRREVG